VRAETHKRIEEYRHAPTQRKRGDDRDRAMGQQKDTQGILYTDRQTVMSTPTCYICYIPMPTTIPTYTYLYIYLIYDYIY